MAVDVETKSVLNVIPYSGKDDTRAPSNRLSDWVVMNCMNLTLKGEEILSLTTSLPRTAWPRNCDKRRRAQWERSTKSEESSLHQQKKHKQHGI